MRRLPMLLTVLGLCIAGAACGGPGATCQAWTYHTRAGEDGSRLYVCRVENYVADGMIYHVYVDGLHLRGPDGGERTVVPHLALTRKAFLASVRERVDDDAPLPAYREGYAAWSKAFKKNEAKVYDVPVAACLDQLAAD